MADLVLSTVSLLVLAVSGLVIMRLVRLPVAGSVTDSTETLTDGAVLLADGDRVVRLAEGARQLLGDVVGEPVADVLGRYLAPGQDAVIEALERLQATGEPVDTLAEDAEGRAVELHGGPAGGHLRLVIRDASFTEDRLTIAAAEIERREAELARQASANQALAALIERAPLIAWSRDTEGQILWSGGRIEFEDETIGPAEVIALLSRRDDDGVETTGNAERSRLEVVTGPDRSLAVHVTETVAADGGRYGFAVDASMAASAERTLSRFVQTMTETFAHLTVGLAIFDRNKTLALFNPALVQMWQLDASWLARRPSLREIIEALRSTRRIPEVENFHEWRGRLLALFGDTEQVDYEELWHLGDGSNIRVLARPHPHGSLAFVFDDVTERLRLEQRFRHSIDLRRATLDRMDEGLMVFRHDGQLQFVNAAFHRIWGTDQEALGPAPHAREVIELCSAASVEVDVWQRVIAFITADPTRRPWKTRLTLGSGRVLSLRVAALPDGSAMVLFSDITDSERIATALTERNEALEAAGEMRTAVLDRISHRLRTPLNTIFGFAQLIADTRFGDLSERQKEYASGILEAASALLDTIDDVTELAGLEIDPLHDDCAPQQVWDLLQLTVGLLQKRAISIGAALETATPKDGDAHLTCDMPALRQIVFSMAAEALQRGCQGRRIILSAETGEDAALVIRVSESGGGPAAVVDSPSGERARSFIERMVTRAGGHYDLAAGDDGRVASAVCKFPGVLVPEEAEELHPVPEEEEMLDDLVRDQDG